MKVHDKSDANGRFTLPKKLLFLIAGYVFCIILYVLSELSTEFADFYTDNIFPAISTPFAVFSSIFPFSFGEILIILGIFLIFPGSVIAVIFQIKKHRGMKFYLYFVGFSVLFAALTETLNCFIEYRCSSYSQRYMSDSHDEYTISELTSLVDYLIDNANSLAEKQTRDENGLIILPDNVSELSGEYMKKLSEDTGIERLSGFYTTPKYILSSRFMSKANLQGIYFPFSMEANINADMLPARVPDTMCHELSHTKGFILEDEAGFIAYLACVNSGDDMFMYSGFLSAMTYSVNELYTVTTDDEKTRISQKMSDLVRSDNKFISDEYKKSLESDKVLKKETVSVASDKALNSNLKINGVEDGTKSYRRIVTLLLKNYYSDN